MLMIDQSDETLVTNAQRGDGDAFEQLVTRHYDMILRVGYRLIGSQTQAEDLAQDICASLVSKLASFRGDAKFTTWLYRVTMNAAKDHIRKQRTRKSAHDAWGDVTELHSQTTAAHQRELEWLTQAMRALPDDLRETLVLTLTEDMTHTEAAEVLNISAGTVSWRIAQAKKHLRAIATAEERYP